MNSSLLDLQHTSSHAYDFEIPLKSFKSPLVVDLVTATSTTPDLEFLQRILPIEDLIELWIQNPRSTIRRTRHTLFSLLMIIFGSPKKEEAQQYGQKRVSKWIEKPLNPSGKNNGLQTHEINK